MSARTNTATAIPMRGMLKDHASNEPAGFTGNGEIDGWKKAFSRRELARIWSLTGDTMQAVGYDRDGLLNPPTPGSIES